MLIIYFRPSSGRSVYVLSVLIGHIAGQSQIYTALPDRQQRCEDIESQHTSTKRIAGHEHVAICLLVYLMADLCQGCRGKNTFKTYGNGQNLFLPVRISNPAYVLILNRYDLLHRVLNFAGTDEPLVGLGWWTIPSKGILIELIFSFVSSSPSWPSCFWPFDIPDFFSWLV